jgi:hemerythrin
MSTSSEEELIRELRPIEWDEQIFGSGITTIDDQHRVLFGIYNLLIDKIRARDLNLMDAVNLSFELEEFVKMHFQYEEDCMRHYGCVKAEENIEGHKIFRRKLDELIALLKETLPSFREIAGNLVFLKEWLETHIKGIDSSLNDCKTRFEARLEESVRFGS